jgi:hypothetical protein
MANMPGAAGFTRPPEILERGISRVRASSAAPWRGPLPEGEHFNQSVHCDWMCIGTRAFWPLDGTWGANPVAGPAPDLGTRVVNDALVMVDWAYRVVRVVTVASHSEFADCMENWVHSLCAMRTLSADCESANHSANARELRQHYGVSFDRRNAPYHPHHNGPVKTMVHLLKRLIVDMCRIAGLSVAAQVR